MAEQATMKIQSKSTDRRTETLTGKQKITREESLLVFEKIRKQTAHLPEMTMEDIDAEIRAARAERRAKMAATA